MHNPTKFNHGLDIQPTINPIGFEYGKGVFGPKVENRNIDDIRSSLFNPACKGPSIVYSIAMDVGKVQHKSLLEKMHLLYGVVTYATGKMGKEPIRSQGHIHKVSNYSGWSTPEIYEIWTGEAIIYMQEYAEDNPGRCFAINAMPGEIVIVPPNWAHATISANPTEPLTFGAWCDRDYGFEYSGIRAHDGIAWFPLFNDNNQIVWEANPAYKPSKLIIKSPNDYPEFGIEKGKSIYEVFEENPDTFLYVPSPQLKKENWSNFEP